MTFNHKLFSLAFYTRLLSPSSVTYCCSLDFLSRKYINDNYLSSPTPPHTPGLSVITLTLCHTAYWRMDDFPAYLPSLGGFLLDSKYYLAIHFISKHLTIGRTTCRWLDSLCHWTTIYYRPTFPLPYHSTPFTIAYLVLPLQVSLVPTCVWTLITGGCSDLYNTFHTDAFIIRI